VQSAPGAGLPRAVAFELRGILLIEATLKHQESRHPWIPPVGPPPLRSTQRRCRGGNATDRRRRGARFVRQGFTLLHLASQEHALAAAAALLNLGATVDPINSFGNTPLFVAVFNSRGRPEIIELMRSRGADPLHQNATGQTPAALAILIGNYWNSHVPKITASTRPQY
jgi:hypothetical protein